MNNSNAKSGHKITWFTRIAYGSANLIGSGASNISNAWLLFFLTAFGHIPAWQASLIFAITSYMDVIANPIVGFISDNLYSTKIGRRFGRRRFFLLISMPLMILYPAIWISGMSFWYYLVTYMGFELVYDLIMVPYDTLAVEMTSDFKQRTYLTGTKALFGNAASFLTGALPGVFFTFLGKKSPYAYLATSLTWGLVMLFTLVLVYKNSWERTPEEVTDEHVDNFWEGLKKMFIDVLSTFRVRAFRLHLGNYLFGAQGALVIFTTMFTYYVVYALQRSETLVSGMNSINSIVQIGATFAFIFICAKKGFMGPNKIALGLLILCVLAFGSIYWLGLSSNAVFIAIMAISVLMGIAMGGTYYIPWTVYVFMADIDELVTNRRREGILAGAMYTCNKFLKATILFIIGALLSSAGFKEGLGTQSDAAVHAIVWLFVGGTILFTLVAVYSTFKLTVFNQQTHQVILDELKRVHGGGKIEDVSEENRKICEQLTGFSYEDCFGNNNVGYKEK
ncbi:MFS transporter [Levilactobacillus tujiorum]|uniref:MFS transporter n=1 Tax=Levilactobacillus tujiorum TaxID=2912243 RepID=A0ABX1L178_9LACO|nr:MFS transporter [Levilactobacillus tujiorum]MCH5463825.1 MFS transporter [Levilactobacillus tujiorum]NLR11032.1 MFS transporter [Lactobacillus sp. HBUAS51387]NLR28770.1 MFS transporter [Levilactobacillus tujiorum]